MKACRTCMRRRRSLPSCSVPPATCIRWSARPTGPANWRCRRRSEEHTSELQSLMRISYAVFCLKQKNIQTEHRRIAYKKIYINILHQQTQVTHQHSVKHNKL